MSFILMIQAAHMKHTHLDSRAHTHTHTHIRRISLMSSLTGVFVSYVRGPEIIQNIKKQQHESKEK